MKLDPVAIELDPRSSPLGTLSIDDAGAGSIMPGKGTLTTMAAVFLRWNAMVRPG
jgi:hypothetical protein